MAPRSREMTIALIVISALFFVGSVLPYVRGPVVFVDAPRAVDPSYWTYWQEVPLYIGVSALTFLLPLVALIASRISGSIRARLLLIALLAAAGSWNIVDIPLNREFDLDSGIGAFLITAAAVLAIAMAVAQSLAGWRAPSPILDRPRIRLSLVFGLLGTALFTAGTVIQFSDFTSSYKVYEPALIALTVLGSLAAIAPPTTARRFSLFLLPTAALGWFAFPAYIVTSGYDPQLEDWLHLGASVFALAGVVIGLTASIRSGEVTSPAAGSDRAA
jgi:hypothetical protein